MLFANSLALITTWNIATLMSYRITAMGYSTFLNLYFFPLFFFLTLLLLLIPSIITIAKKNILDLPCVSYYPFSASL